MRILFCVVLLLFLAGPADAKDYKISCLPQTGITRYIVMKSALINGTWGPEIEVTTVYASSLTPGRLPTATITVAPAEQARVWFKVCGQNPSVCTGRLDAQYLLTPVWETPLPPPAATSIGVQ